MTLRLVHSRQVACWPWGLRAMEPRRVLGAVCRGCRIDVALPIDQREDTPICIYCALDNGIVEAVDVPLDEPWPYADSRQALGSDHADQT